MKILTVDDVGYSRRSLSMLLEKWGHTVVESTNAQEALATLQSDQTIDVVITDLIMDGMDGVDLFLKARQCESIHDDGLAQPPPFVLLTSARPDRTGLSQAQVQRVQLAKRVGFRLILYKPVDPKALVGFLEKIKSKSTVLELEVSRSLQKLQDEIDTILGAGDTHAALPVLECLENQVQRLRELVATENGSE